MMSDLQAAKAVVRNFHDDLDLAMRVSNDAVADVLRSHTTVGYQWRGMHPFYELNGADAVAAEFYAPLVAGMSSIQRRPDIFMAGHNDVDGGATIWVCQMGHLLGLFDGPWLGIRPTRRMAFFRYAEFHRIEGGKIAETAHFFDVVSMMQQAGQYPLPPQTGAAFVHPGPRTHDGLLTDRQDPAESVATMDLVNRMAADLSEANRVANETGDNLVPPESLAASWADDMIWYGPAGIGATYTIPRYQDQHQYPFRFGLTDKVFNGHVARFAEGHYAGFFGWSNLTNRAVGGFMGLPGSHQSADMRVVDVYRREGDKLVENWVFIDLLHWLFMQGLDVLGRMRHLNGEADWS